MRRRERQEIQARQERAEQAESNGGVFIQGVDHIRVVFAEKPPRKTRRALRAAGFRWYSGAYYGRRENLPAVETGV